MAAKKPTAKKPTKAGAGVKPTKAGNNKPELERHPLSERYGPKMSTEELQGLADDLKAHGMHEPIIMYEGKVLAGWNRYLACVLAKVEPERRELPAGKDPAAVAFGTNFLRRKLGSVQKAFYGAQFCIEANLKQGDVATMLACNLNRLNQCCQLFKLETPAAKLAITELRDNAEFGSAQFDELMLELGIARPSTPRPARASAGGAHDFDDDETDFEDDDLTAGAIDLLDDPTDDEVSPEPATRTPKGGKGKPGDPVGDEDPLPPVGTSRTSMKNPHETPASRVAKLFRRLDAKDQRSFVKFAWKTLHGALDAAISHGDVEYELPGVVPDPSVIARTKPAGKLDDGHTPKGSKPAAKKKPPPPKKPATKSKAAAKKAARGKAGKDADI